VMSPPIAARRNNGSSTVDAAAAAAGRTLGHQFGRGGPPLPRAVGPRGVGLPPPPHSRGLGGGSSVGAASIDGYVGGDFSSSSGFPFPPASSQPLFDATGVDPSSPGSW
jgi:hypothetical protein